MTLPWITLHTRNKPGAAANAAQANLAGAQPGQEVVIRGYGQLAPAEQAHLQAYGLVTGRKVRVLQQRPVTVVLIEQTELAFEHEVACEVLIDQAE